MDGVLWCIDTNGFLAHSLGETIMQSAKNIHVQQHKAHMINEEWNKTQNDALFVAFHNMHAVTFVLPDEMADVSMAGLQWFMLIPRLTHTGSHRPSDSHSKPYRENKMRL